MKTQLNKIILEWIGEIDVPYFEPSDIHESGKIVGKNQALQDLRNKSPELVDRIIEALQKVSEHDTKKFLDGFSHPKDCDDCNLLNK